MLAPLSFKTAQNNRFIYLKYPANNYNSCDHQQDREKNNSQNARNNN